MSLNCHVISPSEGNLTLLYVGEFDVKIRGQMQQ